MNHFPVFLRRFAIFLGVAAVIAGFILAEIEAVKEDNAHVAHCQSIGGWVSRKDIITPIYTIGKGGQMSVSYAAVEESYCWTESGLRDNW